MGSLLKGSSGSTRISTIEHSLTFLSLVFCKNKGGMIFKPRKAALDLNPTLNFKNGYTRIVTVPGKKQIDRKPG